MSEMLLRWPVLGSLLFALLGGFLMVYGLAVDNAEFSRDGLAVVVSLAPLPLLLRAWGKTYLSPVRARSGFDAAKADGVSPFNAPPLVAWKEAIERRVLGASNMRGVVIVSGTAYGDGGGGIPGVLLGSPRDGKGNLVMIGTGQQHWATVHVADLADFFRRVLESGSAHGYYVIGNGSRATLAELTEAAAVALGAPGAVPGSEDEARARLGDYLAEVLLLDQGTDAAKARADLGWSPSHLSLVDEFRHGNYRQ